MIGDKKHWHGGGSGSAVYGLGFVGAAVYFVQHAIGTQAVIMGILKAIIWPAILVFKAFELLGM